MFVMVACFPLGGKGSHSSSATNGSNKEVAIMVVILD